MIDSQILSRGVRGIRTIYAMRSVPRHAFLTDYGLQEAYSDRPLRIGNGQTISQPYIVALMTSQFENLPPGTKIMEIGSGCGYQTAILVQMGFEVHSIEILPKLIEKSTKALRDLRLSPESISCSDGRAGLESKAPFTGIIAAACAEEIPSEWLNQLQCGGVIIAPIGSKNDQNLVRLDKISNTNVSTEELCPVRFVPLV